MKKVLFFLLTLLTLSSCSVFDKDSTFSTYGKIEKVDTQNKTIVIDDVSYQIQGKFEDCLSGEKIDVGDWVSVVSFISEFKMTKLDYLISEVLYLQIRDLGDPYKAFFLTLQLMFFIIVTYFLYVYGKNMFQKSGRIFCLSSVLLVFALFCNYQLGSFKYQKSAEVEKVDGKMIVLEGKAYCPFPLSLRQPKNGELCALFHYLGNDYVISIVYLGEKPEFYEKALRRQLTVCTSVFCLIDACLCGFFLIAFLLSKGKFFFVLIRKIVPKKRHFAEAVDENCGHGSFVKK